MVVHENEKMICDFTLQDCPEWRSVDDLIMGGISASRFRCTADLTGSFSGILSLENNGGFASARTVLPERDFRGYSGIMLRLKGDGKRYSFRIRNDERFDGIVYKSDFDTLSGEWLEAALPFSGFKPVFRGRILDNVPPIDLSNIVQIGILISGKQQGAFCLLIEWIKAYR